MLSEKDRQEYKQGIYDLYCEVGTTKIKYYPNYQNTANTEQDIYGENDVIYSKPLNLVGNITPLEPTANSLDPSPLMGVNIFNFIIPILSLEKHNLDPYKMTLGLFEFNNQKYKVLDVVPQGMFTDFFSEFKFSCEMVGRI